MKTALRYVAHQPRFAPFALAAAGLWSLRYLALQPRFAPFALAAAGLWSLAPVLGLAVKPFRRFP